MKTNPKTFLFLGDDSQSQSKIKELQAKFLDAQSREFNYDLVEGKELKIDQLNDLFSRFPIGSQHRLIEIRDLTSLPADSKPILCGHLKKLQKNLVVIMRTTKTSSKDDLVKKVSGLVDFVYSVKEEYEVNVFDLCKAMLDKKTAWALKLLKELDVTSANSAKILGAIIWQWEQLKQLIRSDELEKSFNILYEADKRIKTGQLKPVLALEMVVISLTTSENLFF